MKTTLGIVKLLNVGFVLFGIGSLLVIAIIVSSAFLSEESVRGMGAVLISVERFLILVMFLLVGATLIWSSHRSSAVRSSREECRKAYEALYRHFAEHSLEGPNTERCQFLQRLLDTELSRHALFFREVGRPPKIKRYHDYLWKMRETNAVR